MDAAPSHKVLALPEMLDEIFSHLHLPLEWDFDSDRSALRVCVLVNRLWAETGRHHLWSALSFKVVTPGAVDKDGQSLEPSSLESLHDFLTSRNGIREAVRSLRLVGYYGGGSGEVSASALYSVFSALPALQNIVLDCICLRLVDPPQDQPRLSMRSIKFCGGRRSSLGSLTGLLILTDMFSDVGELVFADLWLAALILMGPSPHKTLVTSITSHGTTSLIATLRHFDTEHLTAVPMTLNGTSDAVQIAIPAIGAHRTELSIRLNDAVSHSAIELQAYSTILSACRCLQHVHFIFDHRQTLQQHWVGWKRLVEYTSHLPGTVKTILIDFSCGARRGGTEDAFVLAQGVKRLPELIQEFEDAVMDRQQDIRIRLVPGGKPVFSLPEQARLRTCFPKLSAEGLLDF